MAESKNLYELTSKLEQVGYNYMYTDDTVELLFERWVKLKLPEGVSLPEGIELPEIEVSKATIRKTVVGKDGKTYEVEKEIELPIIK